MNQYEALLLAGFLGYLLGGLNMAILMSKALHHEDIREKGSGNPGFTNYKRVYGSTWESGLVFLSDVGKTILAVALSRYFIGTAYGCPQTAAAFTGLCTMLGHSYPLWYRFRGGKAFLAGMATVFFVDWRIGLVCLGVFLFLLFTFHLMSLASISALALFPILVFAVGSEGPIVKVSALLAAGLCIWRHRANILRLAKGEEKRFYFHAKTRP